MASPRIPRGTFWIGAFCGAGLGLPLLILAVALADPSHGLDEILIHIGIFAGIPAMVTTGGVARWVADRLADAGRPTWRLALRMALPAMAVAGAGLGLLTAVPLRPTSVVLVLIAATAAGIVLGAAVAWLVAMRQKRHTWESDAPKAG